MGDSIEKIMNKASQVKLSGGLVGRVCTVLFVACICIGAIGVLSRNDWIMGGAVIAILLLAFPMLWRIISFAERHPGVALLDGAQLLKHEQLRLASKQEPEILVVQSSLTEGKPVLVSDEQALLADSPPTELLPTRDASKEVK